LVSFKSEEVKTEIMSKLRNLCEASTRFKGIGVAHDFTPRQRTEVKRVLAEAKSRQASVSQQENSRKLQMDSGRPELKAASNTYQQIKSSSREQGQLKGLYLNARRIIYKFDVFRITVHEANPDIIGVTESWANRYLTPS